MSLYKINNKNTKIFSKSNSKAINQNNKHKKNEKVRLFKNTMK